MVADKVEVNERCTLYQPSVFLQPTTVNQNCTASYILIEVVLDLHNTSGSLGGSSKTCSLTWGHFVCGLLCLLDGVLCGLVWTVV